MVEYIGTRTIDEIRRDFPIFAKQPGLAYLDSAATAQLPMPVLEALVESDIARRANVHRGAYPLAEAATEAYEAARGEIAQFVGAQRDEVVFTPSATWGMAMVADMCAPLLTRGDGVLVSSMEHHSALLPWRRVAASHSAMVTTVPHTRAFRFDMDTFALMLNDRVKFVVVSAASNVLGTVNPVKAIIARAHAVGARVIVDATQYVPHRQFSFADWGADAVVFSGHKAYGPMGIGVLLLAKGFASVLTPSVQGGGMVRLVERGETVWEPAPRCFEPGTPNVAGALGLAAALRYLHGHSYDALQEREEELTRECIVGLLSFGDIAIVGPNSMDERIGVVSFIVPGIHPHDLATVLGEDGVCIRGGFHCAQPLVQPIDSRGVCRISMGLYTTREDIARCIASIHRARALFV